jgi:hypothetical protein
MSNSVCPVCERELELIFMSKWNGQDICVFCNPEDLP